MLTICAWCLVHDGKLTVLKHGDSKKGISHGICKKCKKDTTRELEEMLRKSKWL